MSGNAELGCVLHIYAWCCFGLIYLSNTVSLSSTIKAHIFMRPLEANRYQQLLLSNILSLADQCLESISTRRMLNLCRVTFFSYMNWYQDLFQKR